jgi:hypothetical protein
MGNSLKPVWEKCGSLMQALARVPHVTATGPVCDAGERGDADHDSWEALKSLLSGGGLGRVRQCNRTSDSEPSPARDFEPLFPAANQPSQGRLLESLRLLDDTLQSFEQGCKPSSARNPS